MTIRMTWIVTAFAVAMAGCADLRETGNTTGGAARSSQSFGLTHQPVGQAQLSVVAPGTANERVRIGSLGPHGNDGVEITNFKGAFGWRGSVRTRGHEPGTFIHFEAAATMGDELELDTMTVREAGDGSTLVSAHFPGELAKVVLFTASGPVTVAGDPHEIRVHSILDDIMDGKFHSRAAPGGVECVWGTSFPRAHDVTVEGVRHKGVTGLEFVTFETGHHPAELMSVTITAGRVDEVVLSRQTTDF